MAAYRVVCVDTEHPHRHITHVCTGSAPDTANKCWTVAEVRTAIINGDTFYTVSASTGKRAGVRLDDCRIAGCTIKTIRSDADAISDDNLDNLRVAVTGSSGLDRAARARQGVSGSAVAGSGTRPRSDSAIRPRPRAAPTC